MGWGPSRYRDMRRDLVREVVNDDEDEEDGEEGGQDGQDRGMRGWAGVRPDIEI